MTKRERNRPPWALRKRRKTRDGKRGRRGPRKTKDERPTNTRKSGTNKERTTKERYATYHDSPKYHENIFCLQTATHYGVSCSIGNTQQTMLPFSAVFDTGSGMNIVKRDALLDGLEKLLDKDATIPQLGDANGRQLRLLGEITLLIRFGNTTYRVPFIVADKLAVKFIIGRRFMNRYVDAIECLTQTLVEIFLTFGPRVDRSVQNFAMGR